MASKQASGDLRLPSLRKRRFNPKSKTGCLTCKRRHVKCDELKPICVRCQDGGFDCSGYQEVLKRSAHQKKQPYFPTTERRILPASYRHVRSSVLVQGPSHTPFLTEYEHRYFQVFCKKTARSLSPHFKLKIWQTLLQLSHKEAFISYAITALGALHETMESATRPNSCGQDYRQMSESHHEFALQTYSRSLVLMKDTKALGYWNCIISSILTTCFEIFHGNQESALAQAQTGLSLMAEFNTSSTKALSTFGTLGEELEDELNMLFNHMDRETWILGRKHRPVRQHTLMYAEGSEAFANVPKAFGSVKKARLFFDFNARQFVQWRIICDTEHSEMNQRLPSGAFDEFEATELQKRDTMLSFKRKAEQWKAAFDPLFRHSRTPAGKEDFLGATILAMIELAGRISFTIGHPKSVHHDRIEEYVEVIKLARQVFEHPDSKQISKQITFSFDYGVLYPLFIVATRCRDPRIRRETISLLLDYPRREGIWDSAMIAMVATRIMKMEESSAEAGKIPESARLQIVSNKFDLSKRQAELICSRKAPGIEERVTLPMMKLKW